MGNILYPYWLQAINLFTDSRCAVRHKNPFVYTIAKIEFEILLFGQNYLISIISNTINFQNINIVTAFICNI